MTAFLRTFADARRTGSPRGITSVCSAHPWVLEAAIDRASRVPGPALIEATCNQVNQFGGYTGKSPADFAKEVLELASAKRILKSDIILGGDHLGPNPWRKEPAAAAMAKAEEMVAAYVKAGFTKIHLDASMACADDPALLNDEIVAERAARLARVAEAAALEVGSQPVYVLGTEVPVPGGADHVLDTVEPTKASDAQATIDVHRQIFTTAGLSDAFDRCIAFVVQPGVEFGNENIIEYKPLLARDLTAVLDTEQTLVFEAHSTDYQSEASLTALVRDGFPILKVGPGLTFALREALLALDLIASELDRSYSRKLAATMEQLMLNRRDEWQGHYHGNGQELILQLRYSYSDRIRYYWGLPDAVNAVHELENVLAGRQIPQTLASQYLGRVAEKLRPSDTLVSIAKAYVNEVLDTYGRACNQIRV